MGSMAASRAAPSRATLAQHRVDQRGIVPGVTILLREPHRKIDRGVVGHVEKQDLRGADQQRAFDPRRAVGKTAFEQAGEQMTQRAEPAHDGRDDGAHQRAVALVLERIEVAGFKLLVERPLAPQHALDDVRGDAPGGEAGGWRVSEGAAGSFDITRLS